MIFLFSYKQIEGNIKMYHCETVYNKNLKPLMTTLFKIIPNDFGVTKSVIIATSGDRSLDYMINLAKEFKRIK